MLCSFSKKNFFVQHLKVTYNNIGDAGAESISRALKTNTSLKSLDISSVLFCSSIFHTQQVTKLGLVVLRAFREHSKQTLHSHHLLFAVCYLLKHLSHSTDNDIGDSGVESISGALQSNTSLTSLDIASVVLITHLSQTQQITVLEILVLRAFREHFNQTLLSNHLLFTVC